MTRFQLHKQEWENCQRCELCHTRQRVVLFRGVIPCDVLFIGEAPGRSEDSLGRPFIGPAGKLLDQIIERSFPHSEEADLPQGYALSYGITNLVGCIPLEGGKKTLEPSVEQIQSCAPRLQEIVEIAKPKLLVAVGNLARDWIDQKYAGGVRLPPIPQIAITHPSAILRANIAQRGLLVQRAIVAIRDGVEEILSNFSTTP